MSKLDEGLSRGPLSPHLQVYNMFALTSFLSMLHRIFGVVVFCGTLLFVFWIGSAAAGPEYYDFAMSFLGSWFGYLILFGWSFTLIYHMCNGVRHMLWDTGRLLPIEEVYTSGYIMAGCALGLTAVSWIVGLSI